MALSFFLILSHHLVPSALIASLLLSLSQQFVNIFVTMLFPGFHAVLQVWPKPDTYQSYCHSNITSWYIKAQTVLITTISALTFPVYFR